ncbi:pyridoxal-phosphate dependent enzyme [Candidatus Sumerlaeota bacterium]|nr:pyridoxal-phosphate dependent enzyme [Candidatus Sumerlaeota bacterium]
MRDSSNPYHRFRDILPVADSSLYPSDAEFSPTVHAQKLGNEFGMPRLYLKNETVLPTGTTKDRMAAVALAYLYECGVRGFCASSTGNSSTAYAHAMGRFDDLTMYLFTASQFRNRVQCADKDQIVQFVLRGATFVEAFDTVKVFADRHGFVPERGFFNPGRREGLKVAFLEAAEQIPDPIDWYVQAVSSAMGVHGTFKGAKELLAMKKITRLPRLLCVQQETCAPMVKAWSEGAETIQPRHIVERPTGIASAILRGNPQRAYPHVRKSVLESGGTMTAVSETEIREARAMVEELEGISPCFSASAAVAGWIKLARRKEIPPEHVVLINLTGSDRKAAASEARFHWLKREGNGWTPENPGDEVTRALWNGQGPATP